MVVGGGGGGGGVMVWFPLKSQFTLFDKGVKIYSGNQGT